MYRLFLASIIIVIAMITAANAQINNGGFESPSINSLDFTVHAGDATLPSWNVTQGSVDVVNEVFLGTAFEGSQYIDLDGTSTRGEVEQTFATASGQQYFLSFAYANNFNVPSGAVSGTTASVTVESGTINVLSPTTVSHTTSTASNLDWLTFSMPFFASDTLSTVRFTSLSPLNSIAGVLIDDVRVTPVPEPATALLVFSGLLASTAFRRNR